MQIRHIIIVFLISLPLSAQNSFEENLTNYWSFDGQINDAIGGNHGVLSGNIIYTPGKNGKENSAVYFDGSGDYIKIKAPTSSELSISFWIKPDSLIDDMRILSSLGNNKSTFSLRYYNNSIQMWEPWISIVPYPIEKRQNWSLICLSIDSNYNVTSYINGIPGSTNQFDFQWSEELGIGSKFLEQYGFNFKGSIDELKFFNKVLSPEEVQSLYNSQKSELLNTLFIVNNKVGINTSTPDMELTVKGKIHSEEVKIDLQVPVPDYVFDKEYSLKNLKEVEDYILKYKHLPDVPSAKEIKKNGLMLAEMEMLLLKKIEELTLYLIMQQKEIEYLTRELSKIK